MPHRQHRLEPNYAGPDDIASKSPAPPVVVECWCLMVATMDHVRLDKFTRETWKKFDAKDLEPLKWAILRRRRALTMQLWPSPWLPRAPCWWRTRASKSGCRGPARDATYDQAASSGS